MFQSTSKVIVTAAAAALSLSGCANFFPPATVIDLPEGAHAISSDASRTNTLVTVNAGKLRSCAAPSPDVAITFANALKATLPNQADVDATLSATAVALAGRDDGVLLAREGLFTICELNANGAIKDADVMNAFQEVFKGVVAVETAVQKTQQAKAENANAQTNQIKASTEQLRAKAQVMQMQQQSQAK